MPRRPLKKTYTPSPKVKAFKQGVSNLKQGAVKVLKTITSIASSTLQLRIPISCASTRRFIGSVHIQNAGDVNGGFHLGWRIGFDGQNNGILISGAGTQVTKTYPITLNDGDELTGSVYFEL